MYWVIRRGNQERHFNICDGPFPDTEMAFGCIDKRARSNEGYGFQFEIVWIPKL